VKLGETHCREFFYDHEGRRHHCVKNHDIINGLAHEDDSEAMCECFCGLRYMAWSGLHFGGLAITRAQTRQLTLDSNHQRTLPKGLSALLGTVRLKLALTRASSPAHPPSKLTTDVQFNKLVVNTVNRRPAS
jgi:hypothetical protein